MRIRVLGCSGGIGLGLRTTSLLLDEQILIDAGTGVGDLTLAELRGIRHIFLTHSHLDHVAGLPLFLDSVFDDLKNTPLTVYASAVTIDALRKHIFNWVIWPDFTALPSAENPVVRFQEITAGERVKIGAVALRAVDVHHSVPSLGFCIEQGDKVFAFSGDTMTNKTLWPVLNDYPNLDVLVMEVSFPDAQHELAAKSMHYTPRTLAADLKNLKHDPAIWVTAMKPGAEDEIFAEIRAALPDRALKRMQRGEIFEL